MITKTINQEPFVSFVGFVGFVPSAVSPVTSKPVTPA